MEELLRTKFLGRELRSPLVLPAGIMGISASSMQFISRAGVGMVTTKSLTLSPRVGHLGPVTEPVEGGLLNCMGLCNPGIEEGLEEAAAYLAIGDGQAELIISIFAAAPAGFVALAKRCGALEGTLLELNLSCPNVLDEFGTPLAASASQVGEIVAAVKGVSPLPVIAKLSPNVTDIVPIAKAAEEAGAEALCLINTLGPGLAIDIQTVRPILFNGYGGLSGACVKPIALRLVHLVSRAVDIPVIGMGGVSRWEDAVEMLMAGAALVGIGTALMDRGPEVFTRVNNGIAGYMKEKNLSHIEEIPKLGEC